MQHYSTRLQTTRFELENQILSKVDDKLRHETDRLGGSDLHSFKQEVYEYMQSKLKQLTKTYSPKFSQLFKQVESLEDKLRSMNDLNNDTDF